MLLTFKQGTSQGEIEKLTWSLSQEGFSLNFFEKAGEMFLGVVGERRDFLEQQLKKCSFIEKTSPLQAPYKLCSREFKPTNTQVRVKDVLIGGDELQVIAGPCAVENEQELLLIAETVKQAGASVLRGGAFKPRTSPYSFQGLGQKGLQYLALAREKTGLPIITEVIDSTSIDLVADYADIIQIGTRNMYNYALLKKVAQTKKPVLLKRGFSSTIEEWLLAAEYIVQAGNPQVILCERGIRTFETYTRNTLDLSAIPVIKHLTHLPIIIDPSHGTGNWRWVSPMAQAAVVAGADGLMIEVHQHPKQAFSDGGQSLLPVNFQKLMEDLRYLRMFKKMVGQA